MTTDLAVIIAPLLEAHAARIKQEVLDELRREQGDASVSAEWLTEKQVCQRWGVTRWIVREWRLKKQVETVYFGAAIRYRRSSVEEFVKTRTVKARSRRSLSAVS